MGNLYLSICIPTNGRIEIVRQTLDSIYKECKVDFVDFEVVLSDNSNNDELLLLLEEYKQFPNIIYSKTNS
jgi:glycosyltransferase involved in cell wall biosynthesis